MKRALLRLFAVLMVCGSFVHGEEASWEKSIRPQSAGNFPEVPPLRATYEFGWTNIGAAKAQIEFHYKGGRYFFSASGSTYGLARNLWQIDATQTGSGLRGSWLPEKMRQMEHYRSYTMTMDVRYTAQQADRLRMALPTQGKVTKRKIFQIENMRDMAAAMLFVRSQPLRDGDEIAQVVFPGDSAFFVETKVLGRETIFCEGKPVRAIKFNLSMKKILMEGPQKGSLTAQNKFHSGFIWISDDAKRIPIRAELNVFIGYVYAQLCSAEF